jgi:CRP-like cAMP-binding protein
MRSLALRRDEFLPGDMVDQPVSSNHFSTAFRNFTLARAPKSLIDELSPHLLRVDLPQSTSLVKPLQPITWIYFLEHGMASITGATEEGEAVEVGVIGREGLVGVSALLGQPQAQNTILMQGAGSGYRIRASTLREHFLRSTPLQQLVHDFLYLQLTQATQLIVCNRVHEVEARLARWLLMAAALMETSNIHLTQEFLSQMLGTRRSTVTVAAGALQRSGMIGYSRGRVQIVNRDLLEGSSCECYSIIRDMYLRIYPSLY